MSKYVAKQPDAKGYVDFTAEENAIWALLIERQLKVIEQRACDEFLQGLHTLQLPLDRIPQCEEISAVLRAKTGWSVKPVNAIIPLEAFFKLLANRQFPAATFIRTREDVDYLQEPDIFHEYFGHCPMLTNQAYADFIEWYGINAQGKSRHIQSLLGRLFWYTIEFGLMQTPKGLRIYGGGILSSFKETVFALENIEVQRVPFNPARMIETPYHYDRIQECYFVIEAIQELFSLRCEETLALVSKVSEKPDGNNFVIC